MSKAFEIDETRREKKKAVSSALAGFVSNKTDTEHPSTEGNILKDYVQAVVGDLIKKRSHLSDQLTDVQEDSHRKERSIFLDFLNVVDSIDRLLKMLDPTNEVAGSLNALRAQFMQLLEDEKVLPIELAAGQEFNADNCEVSSRQERPDLPDGTIISVERRGYSWKERTLRRARVTISINPKGT